jgi:hypothetical protein
MELHGKVVLPGVRKVRVLALALLVCSPAAAAPTPEAEAPAILTAERVVAGMKGYGLSDLGDGKGIQRFEVEILGLLRHYAPRQDLILARVSGAGLEHSGVIAGMSGSPIYVDDKLIGALAYGWPFSKDPICGITPIQSMLDIRHVPPGPPVPIGGASLSAGAFVAAFGEGRFTEAFDRLLRALPSAAREGVFAPLPLPVSWTGALRPGGLSERVAQSAGWLSAPAGAEKPAPEGAAPRGLQPGSAVSTLLLAGDMHLAATGTVTWVSGESVLAFGHPFLSMGPVDMPMAEARVLTVLPSLFRSFKFSSAGSTLGSITQDRSTGILGTFGTRAAMVPITVRISSEHIPEQVYRFEAVHNSMLTPILAAMAIDNVLTTLEKSTGERTLVWKSSIQTAQRNVRWDSVFTGLSAREEAVTSLAVLTNYLMANEFRDLTILGVDVEIDHSDRLQSARVVHVEAQKERVRPGDTVPVWVDLVDFRGGTRRIVMPLSIPIDTPPGPLTVFVGDGSSATAYDLALYPPDPQSLDQVLDFLGRMRPANSINLLAYRRAPGAVIQGEALAGLPPSVTLLLRDRGPGDGAPELSYLRIHSESIEQPVPVTGSVRLYLEVLPRIS